MAEAAGIVLAVIPICITVVEKYTEVAKLIQKFRKYDEQAGYVSQAISIHKSIYRNAIRILLNSIVSEDEVHQMLSEPVHSLWRDSQLDLEICARLGDSRDAFIEAGSAIKDKLAALEKFGRDCQSQVSKTKEEPATKNLIRRSIRDKIKFAFSEPQIETLITTISRLTQEMQTLIQQTEAPYERRCVSRPNQATKRKIEKFCAVKAAAENLYKALSRACTMHLEHQAHLSLQPVHNDSSQVQFTLAMGHMNLRTGPDEPEKQSRLWLTVESVVSGTLHSNSDLRILKELHPEQKRRRDQESLPSVPNDPLTESVIPQKTTKKRVQFASSESVLPPRYPCTKQLEILPNFCANENFCTQLQRISRQPINGTAACVGYLELSGCPKHLVYLKARAQSIMTAATSPSLVALKDLFDDGYRANLPCDGLMQHERIRIAKHLAVAVMQFQATPWLEKSWNSQEILVSGLTNESTGIRQDGEGPFLDVSIKNPLGPPSRSATFPSRTLIRNGLLFSLGVMMLELAYQKTLAELRKPQDIDQHEDHNTDYFTADRIRHQASAYLGPRYAEVARKCIQCDFGHGNDLNETKLQEGFYQDVICELEALEKTFREFKLSI